ncbi:hypothetical protein HG531_011211 [Fusarium graminearum]|nr:hypothetical protein HG531_011211 [Fusarium graminearum]
MGGFACAVVEKNSAIDVGFLSCGDGTVDFAHETAVDHLEQNHSVTRISRPVVVVKVVVVKDVVEIVLVILVLEGSAIVSLGL